MVNTMGSCMLSWAPFTSQEAENVGITNNNLNYFNESKVNCYKYSN